MKRPSQRTAAAAGGDLIGAPVSPRNRALRLTLEVTFSGGAESWWVVLSRGREWRFPGWLQLEDVMAALNGERPYRSRVPRLTDVAGHGVWLTTAERDAIVTNVASSTEQCRQ